MSTTSYFELFKQKLSSLASSSYVKDKIVENKDTISKKFHEFSATFKNARTLINQKIQVILDSTDLDEKLLGIAAQSQVLVMRMGPDIKILIASLEKIVASDPELAKILAPALEQLYATHKIVSGVLAALNLGTQLATNTSELDAALQNSDFSSVVTNSKEVIQDIINGLKILQIADMLPKTLTIEKIAQMDKDINQALSEAERLAPELVKKETVIEVSRPVPGTAADVISQPNNKLTAKPNI